MSEIDPRALDWNDADMNEPLPTGTVTLLLADVEGSTQLWHSRPDEMTAAIANLDRTLAELVSTHHGVRPIEQGEGDSFVIAFSRASDAVACALALSACLQRGGFSQRMFRGARVDGSLAWCGGQIVNRLLDRT